MVTISKYYSSVTKTGVRPSNPGNVVTVIPEVLNPPDSPVNHSPVTIGSPANGLSLVGQELSLGLASSGVTGALSGTDWSTFNGKIGGSIASGQVAFGTGVNTVGGDAGFRYTVGSGVILDGDIQLTGTQRISTTTGNLSLGSDAGNGNVFITPNGTGKITMFTTTTRGYLNIFKNSSTVTETEAGITIESTQTSGANSPLLMMGASLDLNYSFIYGIKRGNSLAGTLIINGAGGLVGIGTTAPTNLLDVNGTTRIRTISNAVGNFLTTSATGVVQQRTSAETLTDIGAFPSASLSITSGQVAFGTGVNTVGGNNNLFWNNTNGRLGIGTNSPSATFDFRGLGIIQGTTASDSGQLGTELLTTGTGDASWTGTDFATGYTHVAGSVTTLTSTLAGVVNTFYQITYTVTGRTAGSFTIAFGGQSFASLTATGAQGPRATTTGTLVITPTSDFNGTIVLSIRVITGSSASVTFNSSVGTVTNQIRISSLNTNTFIGVNSALRNTTGIQNTFFGASSGEFNTSGFNNTFVGRASGSVNTTGSENSFFGRNSGVNNTTGVFNSFFGSSAGTSNITGSNNSFLGVLSGSANNTGSNNSYFGVLSGNGNTTGSNNTGNGTQSLQNNTTGSSNTANGFLAGRFIADGSTALTITTNSVFIGSETKADANSQTNQIVIGHQAIGGGSNTVVIGNSSIISNRLFGTLRVGTISNAVGNFLTTSATGVVQQRTAGEVATDIGAVTITGTQTITGAKTFDNSLLVLSGTSATFRIASNNNLATLNFRANDANEKATLEFSAATNAFSIATRVNNSDISITPHGTGKIKLSNVPSGSGTVLAIDGSNNLVKSTLISSGTFTPTLIDGLSGGTATYTYTSTGSYTKIGTLVHFSLSIVVTSTTGSPSQPLYISDLPFDFAGGETGMFSISNFTGSSLSATDVGLMAGDIQAFTDTVIRFVKMDTGTTFNSITITTGRIAIAGTYTTT